MSDRVAIVATAWRMYPDSPAARLAAMTGQGIGAADARRYAAGGDCARGERADLTGCNPDEGADKKTQVKAAKASVAVDHLRDKKVKLKNRSLSPSEHTKLAGEVAEHAKTSKRHASKIIDEHMGQKASLTEKSERVAHHAKEWIAHHFTGMRDTLEEEGWSRPAASTIATLALCAKSLTTGPLTMVVGPVVGPAFGTLAYLSGATMATNIASIVLTAKYGRRAFNAGVKLLKRAGGKKKADG